MPQFASSASTLVLASLLGGGASAQDPGSLPRVSERLQSPESADVTIIGSVLEPARLEPTPKRLDRLSLPEGFEISVFAEDLVNPRMGAVADDETVYVTRREVGDVVMLRDTDPDGRADMQEPVASRPNMHGIAIEGDTVYLVTVSEVCRTARRDDGTLEPLGEPIVDDLPAGGQHPNRMVGRGAGRDALCIGRLDLQRLRRNGSAQRDDDADLA